MSHNRVFDEALWERDLEALAPWQRELAQRVINLVCGYLGGSPYHRESKKESLSDRQTLIKHPESGQVFLVLSIVPDNNTSDPYGLRIDFFDRDRAIQSETFSIRDAPRTQWTEKGERRFFLFDGAPLEELAMLLLLIWKTGAC